MEEATFGGLRVARLLLQAMTMMLLLTNMVGAQTTLMEMSSAGAGFSWQSYNDETETETYDENLFMTVGLLEQLNYVTRDSLDYLGYMTQVGSNEGLLKSGKWPTLIVLSADHAFINGQLSD